MQRLLTSIALFALVSGSLPDRDEIPPHSAQQLSLVLESIVKSGYESVTEVSFDEGLWELEATKGQKSVGLRVDPHSGQVVREYADEPHAKLPASAKPLSEIARIVEQAGYSPIRKIDFERGAWEVDAQQNGVWREFHVSVNGTINSH
jgi:hypothetical protein